MSHFEEFLENALRESFAEAMNACPCLLCGQPIGSLHDDAACEAKMAVWEAPGFGGFGKARLKVGDPVVIVNTAPPDPGSDEYSRREPGTVVAADDRLYHVLNERYQTTDPYSVRTRHYEPPGTLPGLPGGHSMYLRTPAELEIEDHLHQYPPVKLSSFATISHDALCDSTDHQCTADCPPLYVAPPLPLRRRIRYALRRGWWWVTGLRVVHRSRIADEDDE